MATTTLPPLLTGFTFGSALTLSGVASPSIITSQFRLTNYHMLLAFLSASACSAAIIFVSNASNYARLGSRKDSSLGWWAKFDGNIVGGALQGIGMGLTGSCPGTVLVQVASGVGKGWEVLLGGALGGVVFVGWDRVRKSTAGKESGGNTVMEKMGWSVGRTVVAYELVLAAVIAAVNGLAPRGRYFMNPAIGGLLIGVAQATSVLASRKTLGVSSAYEDVGKWFWSVIDGKGGPGASNLLFAAGVAAGARATMSYVPATLDLLREGALVSPLAAVTGGFAMIFGARLAGGCTSGHGISDKYRRACALLYIPYIASTFREWVWYAEECLRLIEAEWEMDCTCEAVIDESDTTETPSNTAGQDVSEVLVDISSSATEEPWAMSWGGMDLFKRMLDEKAASGGSETYGTEQCEHKGVSEEKDNEVWFTSRSESAKQDGDAWVSGVVQRLLSNDDHT